MDAPYRAEGGTEPEPVRLKRESVIECARRARREATGAGLLSGVFAGYIGRRYFRFNRNKTLISGILTCVLSSFLCTQAFFGTHIAEAVARETERRRKATSSELIPDNLLQDPPTGDKFS